MKKIITILFVLLIATGVSADYLGIVTRTATRDTLAIPFVLLDTLGNPASLANGDSVYVQIVSPGGVETYRDSMPYNDASIDSDAWEDFAGGQIYTYTERVSVLDGSSTAEGVFSVKIWAQDLTSAALITATTHTFQIVNSTLESSLDSAASAIIEVINIDAWAPILDNDSLIIDQSTLEDLSITTVSGNVDGSVGSVTGAVGSVTGAIGSVGAGGIDAAAIATNAIDADAIADNAIDAGAIATDAIGASEVAANAIGASEIAAAAITISEMPTIAYFDTLIYDGWRGRGIWIDKAASNTDTDIGVDGTENNPVSTFAAAKTLADALDVNRYYLMNRSAFTGASDSLAVTHENWEFIGVGASNAITLDFSSTVDVDGSIFYNLDISGGQGGTDDVEFINCHIGEYKGADGHFKFCGLMDTIFMGSGDDISFENCHSMVAGNGIPGLSFGAGNSNAVLRNYSGGIEIRQMNVNDDLSIEGNGQVIVNADCTAPDITVRGNFTLTDNDGATDWTRDAVFTRQEADLWVWSNTDTLAVDSSLMGEWLSTGINASISDANMGGIADSVWAIDTSDVGAINSATMAGMLKDTTQYQGSASGLTKEAVADAVMDSLEAGTARDIQFKSLVVSNSAGDAVRFISTGSNGDGLAVIGDGSGHGFHSQADQSGGTGVGFKAQGGGTSGQGAYFLGGAIGDGFLVEALGGQHGFSTKGQGGGSDIALIGDGFIASATDTVLMRSDSLLGQGLTTGAIAAVAERVLDTMEASTTRDVKFKSLVISNSAGDAVQFTSTGTNGDGLQITGNGSGQGMFVIAGATGVGFKVTAAGGDGAQFSSIGGNGNGLQITGDGSGTALEVNADPIGGTGHGVSFSGGATSGYGAFFNGRGTNHGIYSRSGNGATGDGVHFEAISTNGNGMGLTATGSGVEITGDDLVDLIWDEILATHTVNGSVGEVLLDTLDALVSSAGGSPSITDADMIAIADTIWDRDTSEYTIANGTMGGALRDTSTYQGGSGGTSAAAVWNEVGVAGVIEDSTGNTTTMVQTNFSEATDDHYNGGLVVFLDGTEANQSRRITDYDGGNGYIVFTPALTGTPASGDSLRIIPWADVDDGGTGPFAYTLLSVDTLSGAAVDTLVGSVKVLMTNDGTGETTGPVTTDASTASISFGLHAGTYTLTAAKFGYVFLNKTITISAAITDTVEGYNVPVSASGTPSTAAVTVNVHTSAGGNAAGVVVYAYLIGQGNLVDSSGAAVTNRTQRDVTNSSGQVVFTCTWSSYIIPASQWRFTVGSPSSAVRKTVTIPRQASYTIDFSQ